jgi:hypothetical protein
MAVKNNKVLELTRTAHPWSYWISEDFKNQIKELLFLVREYGISKLKPDIKKPEEVLEFANYVHEGWKKAQKIICDSLIQKINLRDSVVNSNKGKKKFQDSVRRELLNSQTKCNTLCIKCCYGKTKEKNVYTA